MNKRLLVLAGTGALLLGAWFVFAGSRSRAGRTGLASAIVDRGDIAEVVGATGVLQAVTTVQVGSQVSGTIASLSADFNSLVRKGQVIARLDPSLFEARLAQSQANLVSARANLEKGKAAIDDAKQKYDRARQLAGENLVPQSDLDSAKATYDGALAQDRANQASVTQAEAGVNQAQVDLAHTVIATPIDGVVLARNVDVGQTVAASLQAPTLFVIANDLTRMQVKAAIDEADIGRVRAGQPVSFRVDAYPDQTFKGSVEQVRLQPITNQNVVTYDTLIAVDNPDQKLMPGMTATVSVVIQERKGALRVPAAALRFRPESFTERGRFVFVANDAGAPQPVRLKTGISDGQFTEVLEGVAEGAKVVTGQASLATGGSGRPTPGAGATNNPFAPARPQPRTR